MTDEINESQREFDEKYITSAEIVKKLGITRTTILFARRTGKLPKGIKVNGKLFIWERAKVQKHLDAWSLILRTRGGAAIANA